MLHLIRHGAVDGAGRLNGHHDAMPLAEGLLACRRRARGLAAAQVMASDLSRARLAAEGIAQDLGLPLRLDPLWRELDFGAWEGCDPAELGGTIAAFWDDPQANPPPGGESWGDMQGRVAQALRAIDGDALVITHAGPMRAALGLLLGLSYRQTWAFHLPYAARISLRLWADGAQVTELAA
ncbi:histidine phosphatase family protein [Novosphingobium humi]|uniref:Histidine phosphatase family protein n=1 Tax=Novosphingobium humi TaxID=2282397 RepID=A0ABY7U278_9SPHN|nr:histidine phosphatase family protein [Novosphingobium humi]WCT79609.1 histidine phosphatase family protein [Novosphingobium humi]WJT00400.1 histidine phosphatase family protein [Novosphingobium humi]